VASEFVGRPGRGWIGKKPGRKDRERAAAEAKSEAKAEAVFWIPIRCSDCRSPDYQTYKSAAPVRYHRCRECGARFKSIETTAESIVARAARGQK